MWVPPEETDPVVLHAPTRKSVALFGAVNLCGGQLILENALTQQLRQWWKPNATLRRLCCIT